LSLRSLAQKRRITERSHRRSRRHVAGSATEAEGEVENAAHSAEISCGQL